MKLRDYFGRRPVILTLNYFECPMLCTEVLNGWPRSIGVLNFSIGKEFDVVTVSFDPQDTPELAQGRRPTIWRATSARAPPNGWHFLTGTARDFDRSRARWGSGTPTTGGRPVRARQRHHGG